MFFLNKTKSNTLYFFKKLCTDESGHFKKQHKKLSKSVFLKKKNKKKKEGKEEEPATGQNQRKKEKKQKQKEKSKEKKEKKKKSKPTLQRKSIFFLKKC